MSPAPASTTALPEGALTVTAAVPLWPSLVAVIVAVPAPCPVTSPLPLTVATPALSLDQTIARPASGAPLASRGVAVSCAEPFTWRFSVAGLTSTDVTGTFTTVMAAVPLLPSLVAVIVAEPTFTAVTRPAALTVATDGALLAHVTVRPWSGVSVESSGTAVSWTVEPTCAVADAGLTSTHATGVHTSTLALALLPPGCAVAVTVYAPHAVLRY